MDLREKMARAICRASRNHQTWHLRGEEPRKWRSPGGALYDTNEMHPKVAESIYEMTDAALSALDGGEVEGLCERLETYDANLRAHMLTQKTLTDRDHTCAAAKFLREAATTLRALTAERDALRKRVEKAEAERHEAMREASGLAMCMWRAEYSQDAPHFELLSTPAGVITQIDNMTAGINEKRHAAEAENAKLRERLGKAEAKLGDYEVLLMRYGKMRRRRLMDRAETADIERIAYRVRAEAAEAREAKLRNSAAFLLDRLASWIPQAECDLPDDSHAFRDLGHVYPAAERLRAVLDQGEADNG